MRLLVAAFLLLTSVAANALQQSHPKPTGKESAQYQHPTAQGSQITINNFYAPENGRESDSPKNHPAQEAGPFLTHGEWVSALFSFALVVFSGLAWLSIRHQANIMEKTLSVQEAAFSQWIVLSDWEVRLEPGVTNALDVFFSIVNESDYPFTVDVVTAYLGYGKHRQEDITPISMLPLKSPRASISPTTGKNGK